MRFTTISPHSGQVIVTAVFFELNKPMAILALLSAVRHAGVVITGRLVA
ncbi:hypothetical protein [Frankia sp. CiP3]|nr:hypothetical protein [Frankia sp. CiP3]